MYDAINSRYTYPGTNVLKNKLNIKEEVKLKEYETKMVAFKLAAITEREVPQTFDANHFKWIHQYLFEEVYDFAGKYRLENITKDNFLFSEYSYIEENIEHIFKKIKLTQWKSLSLEELLPKLSEIMTDLNVLHPFRER